MAEYDGHTFVDDSTETPLDAATLNPLTAAVKDHGARIKAVEDKGNPKWADIQNKPTIPAATAAGTRAQLDAGTDTTVRAFTAKDINEFVKAAIAAAATG